MIFLLEAWVNHPLKVIKLKLGLFKLSWPVCGPNFTKKAEFGLFAKSRTGVGALFREGSGKVWGRFREGPGKVQRFREGSGKVQGRFREDSGKI